MQETAHQRATGCSLWLHPARINPIRCTFCLTGRKNRRHHALRALPIDKNAPRNQSQGFPWVYIPTYKLFISNLIKSRAYYMLEKICDFLHFWGVLGSVFQNIMNILCRISNIIISNPLLSSSLFATSTQQEWYFPSLS